MTKKFYYLIKIEDDDDYDPTPYYLWDDTGGEPPMSADERHREAWEEKQRLKGRR